MGLSPEERAELTRAARGFLDRVSTPQQVRSAVENASTFDEDLWMQVADLGWPGIHVPAELGGGGAGYDGLGGGLQEMGRHLATLPFLGSAVLATEVLMRAPNRDFCQALLPRLVVGEVRAAVANDSRVEWHANGGGVRLVGTARFVLDAAGAGLIVVAARSTRGEPVVAAIESAGRLECTPVPTVDRTRRVSEVRFDGVTVPAGSLLAEPGEASRSLMARTMSVGSIAAAADGAGTAERITEITAEHAKNRVQFGRPIGSFQAVKHHCADMVMAVEASRAAVRAALDSLDEPEGDASAAADITASYCGPACSRVCLLAIQVHGGIGFTWEHDAHLYLKRAKLDEMLFGTPMWHRRRLAETVFPRIAPAWGGRL